MNRNQPILFYDGDCGICKGAVQVLSRWDKHGIFEFSPLGSEIAERVLQDINTDSAVLYSNGNTYLQSDAILESIYLLGYPFKVLYIFKIFPKQFRDFVYRFIARNRYRFIKNETCKVPHRGKRQG